MDFRQAHAAVVRIGKAGPAASHQEPRRSTLIGEVERAQGDLAAGQRRGEGPELDIGEARHVGRVPQQPRQIGVGDQQVAIGVDHDGDRLGRLAGEPPPWGTIASGFIPAEKMAMPPPLRSAP